MIYLPENNSILNISSRIELLTLLSMQYWHNNTQLKPGLPENHVNTIVISTADSPNLKFFLDTSKNRKWDINLYFKLLEPPVCEYKEFSLKNLFYYENRIHKTKNYGYTDIINKKIISRINKIKKHPWNLSNVRTFR